MHLDLPGAPPKVSLGLVNGGCFGYIATNDPDLRLAYCLLAGVMEDSERPLRYVQRHGLVLRFAHSYAQHLVPPCDASSSPTALVKSSWHRQAASLAVSRQIAANFPGLAIVNAKSSQLSMPCDVAFIKAASISRDLQHKGKNHPPVVPANSRPPPDDAPKRYRTKPRTQSSNSTLGTKRCVQDDFDAVDACTRMQLARDHPV